jgi:hypothetical protein
VNEKVECLPRYRHADDEAEDYHRAKGNGDTSVFDIPADCHPEEVVALDRPHAIELVDARREFPVGHAWHRRGQHIAELFARGFRVLQSPVISRVDVWLPKETSADSANTNNTSSFVIDLKCRPKLDLDALAAKFFHRDLIDHYRVGQPQILDASSRHIHRPSSQRACIQADNLHILKRSVAEASLLDADVIGSRESRDDPDTDTSPNHAEVGCSTSDGKIQPIISQYQRSPFPGFF